MKAKSVRVAAVQFATTCDVEQNLRTCLRMIDATAAEKPQLMVLPEFCNHLSWYDNAEHAWQVALSVDDDFLNAIAGQAKKHNCYIVINVSLRREYPNISVTSLLFSPDGLLLTEHDKQTLMGHENDFFVRAEMSSPVVDSALGRLGIFPCRDGVTFETPRCLALRGAQIFCDSLNSFALDEASLHVPARAPENKVFLVAANKVGPLIPEQQLEAVSAITHIPVAFLMGAGESQIVAPDGTVLARAPRQGEAYVVADIEVTAANNKSRPDGTDIVRSRRPDIYQAIVQPPSAQQLAPDATGQAVGYVDTPAPEAIGAALVRPATGLEGQAAVDDVLAKIEALPEQTRLVVLPTFFWLTDPHQVEPQTAANFSAAVQQQLQAEANNHDLYIAYSAVEALADGFQHIAVLLGPQSVHPEGCLLRQPQLHSAARYPWHRPADDLVTLQTPLGKVALVCGDDVIYPEVFKLAALQGVHLVLAPFDCQESWENQYGLLSRAAENRICVVASSRDNAVGGGLIASLEREFTIMQPWQQRQFDGNINYPILTRQQADVVTATLYPAAAGNKLMSANTDLLLQRPWHLSQEIVKQVI